MIERLRIEAERYTEHTDQNAAEHPRLSLTWYVDPITNKLAAHWVVAAPEQTGGQELAAAA